LESGVVGKHTELGVNTLGPGANLVVNNVDGLEAL